MLKNSVDFNYLTTKSEAKSVNVLSEASMTIFTGINNKRTRVRVADLLDYLEKVASTNEDKMMSMSDLYEASKKKELIFSHNAVNNIHQKLGIPQNFYQKCTPELKAEIMQEFVQKYDKATTDKNKPLVRIQRRPESVDRVRAVLSSDYVKIDNYPVIKSLFRNLNQELLVRSFFNTDTQMGLEVLVPELAFELTEPWATKPGLYYPIIGVGNSETGNSALTFLSGVYRGACSNGMVIKVAEFFTYVRHIYQDAAQLFNSMNKLDMNLLSEKNNKIIDLYKNSAGIYVENPEQVIYDTMGFKLNDENKPEFDYPIKLVESSINMYNNKYRADKPTYWHVINSITNAINNVYAEPSQAASRVDYEQEFVNVFTKKMVNLKK